MFLPVMILLQVIVHLQVVRLPLVLISKLETTQEIGSDWRTIELGFRPAVVSIQCLSAPYYGTQTQIDGMEEQNISRWKSGSGYTTNTSFQDTFIEITDTGFRVKDTGDNSGMNHNTSKYYYYAMAQQRMLFLRVVIQLKQILIRWVILSFLNHLQTEVLLGPDQIITLDTSTEMS